MDDAVRRAVDLIGGIKTATAGKEKIMLKPNLVGPDICDVTKPGVTKTLARLMMEAGKDVCIGEGSGGGDGFRSEGDFHVCLGLKGRDAAVKPGGNRHPRRSADGRPAELCKAQDYSVRKDAQVRPRLLNGCVP